jgi:hypothetical protein
LIGSVAGDKLQAVLHTTVATMTWRGSVRGGVIVVEDGSFLKEGDEVLIEKISPETDLDEAAFAELKAKLQIASANADSGHFFAPDEVRAEIDVLRKNFQTGKP